MIIKQAGIFALVVCAAVVLGKPAFCAPDTLAGDYVEARSASVYAGACHYNGELTTAGREAILAWNVRSGSANDVKLDGLRALAVVTGDENLGDPDHARRSVLYIDSKATPEQKSALVTLLKTRVSKALGTIVAVKSAPLTYIATDLSVTVKADGIANLSAKTYPCSHCMMPAETWYDPLAPTKSATVAQGVSTGYNDKTLGVSWRQEASDNVFVGTFAL